MNKNRRELNRDNLMKVNLKIEFNLKEMKTTKKERNTEEYNSKAIFNPAEQKKKLQME